MVPVHGTICTSKPLQLVLMLQEVVVRKKDVTDYLALTRGENVTDNLA